MNRIDNVKRAQVVACLVEGNSIRATVRMTGVAKNTVTKLLADLGTACSKYHDMYVRNVSARRVQCDEIWSFCYGKDKNVTPDQKAAGAGSVWTWTAIDADTKLVLSYICGGRDASFAFEFLKDLAARVTTRIQITTDGHRAYAEAVEGVFGLDVDYAQLIKVYGNPSSPDTRYSPGEVVGTETLVKTGRPDPRHIPTSFVERQNLTMRMSMRRFTRLTNAFSKKLENLEAAVALHFMYYNFVRIHQTLRMTPAMAAGLTNRPWEIADIVSLVDISN